MTYVHDDEIRQDIFDGRPDRLASDPDDHAEVGEQATRVPAVRERLASGDGDLLVAFVRQVSRMIEPTTEPARTAAEVAARIVGEWIARERLARAEMAKEKLS